ncbi:Cyclin [Nesidiocoris tenuis]|uniref:Protein CNPPD1 n=1 Tax=Nesidiocoris tenuis TaxID=355587 RepID=A0ABN7ABM2_9HEMI|nr:Cyclin [Nesidiocoris tenuis]
MSVHSTQKKRRRGDSSRMRFNMLSNHDQFVGRIVKTLHYGEKMPSLERLSLPVTELAVELYSEAATRKTLERLRLDEASEINRNACMSPCSFVLALIYLERLKSLNPAYVEKVSPSELFLISMMIATKFLNDSGEEDDVLNSEWANSSGLTLKDVNNLEKEFLNAIDWNVYIDSSNFWTKFGQLERTVAYREGKKNGWFSYTDLEVLLDNEYVNCLMVAQSLVTVSAVCLASYMAGMLAVIGSTMVATQVATACTNLLKHPLSSSAILNVNTTPAGCIDPLATNGTLDCCNLDEIIEVDSNTFDIDVITELQENSSNTNYYLNDFILAKCAIGSTCSSYEYARWPLIRQFNVFSLSAMVPNR